MNAIFATNSVGNYLHMLWDCRYMYLYDIVYFRKTTVNSSEGGCYFTPCLNLYDTLNRNIRKTDMSVTDCVLWSCWSWHHNTYAEIPSAQLFLWSIQTRFAWKLKAVALVFFKNYTTQQNCLIIRLINYIQSQNVTPHISVFYVFYQFW